MGEGGLERGEHGKGRMGEVRVVELGYRVEE